MPQPVSYNPGTPVSGSIQENNISYVVDGQNRNYRGGFGGLSWMSEVPTANNVIFIGNSTSLGRGPANIPLFYPSYNNSSTNIVYAANTLPGSPRNFTTTGSAYNWAVTNNFFINNSNNPIPRIDADGLALYLDASQPTSYPQINNTWYDLSGNGYNGTLTNGPTWNSNGWFQFDGVDDYITTPLATTSGQALTIVGVLYSTETTANYRNFYDSVTQKPMIWWDASGRIEFDAASFTTSAVYRNKWTLVALSKPAGNSSPSYYVNGELVGSGTAYTVPSLTPTWFNRAAAEEWLGNAQLVNFYSRALTTAEIKQNYFQSNIVQDGLFFILDANNLVSYPKSGTAWYSLTGSFSASLVNGPTFNPTNGGSIVFDGVDDYGSLTPSCIPPGNEISISFWNYGINAQNSSIIAASFNSSNQTLNIHLPWSNNTIYWDCGNPFNRIQKYATDAEYQGWHYWVFTKNASTGNMSIYLDGLLWYSEMGLTSTIPTMDVARIGSYFNNQLYHNGRIAQCLIYSKSLSPSEIQQNYQATKDKFQGQQIVTNGLVLNLDSANKDSYPGTGTTWTDLSGNGYNGTLQNGIGFSPNLNGGVLSLDGVDDNITTGITGIVPNSSSPYTVSVWCYRNRNNAGYEELLAQWTFANSGNSFFFGFDNNNVRFTDSWNPVTVSGAGAVGVWMNLVGVYTTTNAYIYLNGVLEATKGSGFTYTGVGPFLIGRQGELSSEYFSGNLGNTLVYNRALSTAEVLQNYNAQKTRFGL